MRDAWTAGAAGEGRRRLGFWAAWSMTVGTMIGSGIFTLPAILAPKGLLGFGGWIISAGGAICLALTLARLAATTGRSGGPYIYAHAAFGAFPGFLMAWAYWASYWSAISAIAIAFVGYLSVFVPEVATNSLAAVAAGLGVIWLLALNALRGVRAAAFAQLGMTVLKLAPLVAVAALGAVAGSAENLPAANPEGGSMIAVFAATAFLTMWAFSGVEAGTIAAGSVRNAERVVPRAIVAGAVTVTVVYLAATAAVMALVPAATLAASPSPFAEAARGFGASGPYFIALGAMISTAGAINAGIIICGEMPMAVAEDGLAHGAFARLGAGGSPQAAIIVSATLSSILLALNYSRGFIGAFQFLLMMSVVTILFPLVASVLAELRRSIGRSLGGTIIAALALAYCLFIIFGSGAESFFWGVVLTASGAPLYFLSRRRRPAAAAE